MPTFKPKSCARCGDQFKPKGANSRFCSDACRDLSGVTPKQKAKAEATEKKRAPAMTGFRGEPPRSTRVANGLATAIAEVELEITTLDARRERLASALDTLRALEADAA